LQTIELGEFIEENVLSEVLYNRTLRYFKRDAAKWNLALTEDEVWRMESVH
jgi:hypothetical protein